MSPTIDERTAVSAAVAYATERGIDTSRYEPSAEQAGAEWLVHFRPGPASGKPSPGDFFTVCVDATSGRATRIVPGK